MYSTFLEHYHMKVKKRGLEQRKQQYKIHNYVNVRIIQHEQTFRRYKVSLIYYSFN